MAYDVNLEEIYASVVIDQKFDPEVMLRGAPSADEMIARSYMEIRSKVAVSNGVAPSPGAVEPPVTFDGFRFNADGKIHGYHPVKSMSRCGKKFIGDELLANVVVGETPDDHLCRICWHEYHAKPEAETVQGEVLEVVDEEPVQCSCGAYPHAEYCSLSDAKPCPECGAVGGPWPDHDRPKSNAPLQSGCPTCGWCF